VELIVHDQRYNDLRSFVAVRSPVATATAALAPLHPCTFLEVHQLATDGFPSLADFEAKVHFYQTPPSWLVRIDRGFLCQDTLELWQVMHTLNAPGVQDLAPESVFTSPVISRQHAKSWAEQLKLRLVQWAQNDVALAERVVSHFSSRLNPASVWDTQREEDEAERQGLFEITQTLLVDGPVLLFCYSRSTTEDMVGFYASKLAALQATHAPDDKQRKVRCDAPDELFPPLADGPISLGA
jgi:hypothetical protein